MNKSSLLITAALVFSTSSAFAGGTLGGNPSAHSGAVNVSVGKCTQYTLDVTASHHEGQSVSPL
ncbi:hypothetical protein FLL78_20175, partial [Vibrio cholerae]|uniref:hypothetical protein n=1 Tax=Vibrio cholerae TaxID=666 RepID=UPI001156E3BE